MKKTDLTCHGDDELIDVVINDVYLDAEYRKALIRGNLNHIKEIVNEHYIYTKAQMNRLEIYFDEEMGNDD